MLCLYHGKINLFNFGDFDTFFSKKQIPERCPLSLLYHILTGVKQFNRLAKHRIPQKIQICSEIVPHPFRQHYGKYSAYTVKVWPVPHIRPFGTA